MLGKGSLLIVLAFSLAFSLYQMKISRAVLSTSDNFNRNYIETAVHESALSATNLAVNKVWDQKINSDTFQVVVNQCTSMVNIYPVGTDTIKVKTKAWGYIFDPETDAVNNQPLKLADSVTAYFSYNMPISQYFWFTSNENGVYWISGDTVWGPVHTNTVLNTNGDPVFYGKVTAGKGIAPNPISHGNRAKFYGGWEVGIKVEIPTDMSPLIAAAIAGNGGAAPNEKCIYNQTTTFDFQSDGSIIRTVGTDPPDTVASLSGIAPTGVIYCSQNVHVKGVFNGQATIYSEGNVYIENDIVYADDPLTNPNSDDLLGLVAANDVIVSDNYANNHDLNVQACVLAVNGSFMAQNYSSRPISGVLRFTGSIVQDNRGPVGQFGWGGSIIHGYSKRYRFDDRLSTMSPPHFPYVQYLRLVSWWE